MRTKVLKKLGNWRIVQQGDSFFVQRWRRHWLKWQWRTVEFMHDGIDMRMDYFPTYEDAYEALSDIGHVEWY